MAAIPEKRLDEIECPHCGRSIPVSEAIRHQLAGELKGQYEQMEKDLLVKEKALKDKEESIKVQEKGVTERVEKEVAKAVSERETVLAKKNESLQQKENQLKEQEKGVEQRITAGISAGLSEREKELKQRETKLSEAELAVEKKVKEGIDQERIRLEAAAKKKAEDAISVEMQDAKTQLQETKEKLKASQKAELDLLKRERELEEKQQNVELEAARKMSALKTEVEESAAKRFSDEHRLKDAEKDKVINDLKIALEDANRKAQQGSQQLQGEIQELDIEAILKEMFPHDEIVPVPKGQRGADALQIVKMPSGTVCGSILWESKRTKTWSEPWIKKLKDDQREAKADIGVIISEVLPKDLPGSGFRDRVWIGNYSTLRLLATALRATLVSVASTRLAAENKGEISDLLFRYVIGPEFRQKVEAMIDTYKEMRETIDREKRAAVSRWATQEKQIEKVIAITAGTYGDLRGLIGSSMQSIPALESGTGDVAEETVRETIKQVKARSRKKKEAPILPEDSEVAKSDDL